MLNFESLRRTQSIADLTTAIHIRLFVGDNSLLDEIDRTSHPVQQLKGYHRHNAILQMKRQEKGNNRTKGRVFLPSRFAGEPFCEFINNICFQSAIKAHQTSANTIGGLLPCNLLFRG